MGISGEEISGCENVQLEYIGKKQDAKGRTVKGLRELVEEFVKKARKKVIKGRYQDGTVSKAKAGRMSNKTQVVPVINFKEKLRRIKNGRGGGIIR